MPIFEFTNKPTAYGENGSKWQAKWQNKGKEWEAIELRKTFSNRTTGNLGDSVLIIVGLNGWNYKNECPGCHHSRPTRISQWCAHDVSDFNVRISMNGPLMGGWDILQEIQQVINEAKTYLEMEKDDVRDAYLTLKY